MKKSARWIPISVIVVFLMVTIGVFIHRYLNPEAVSLTDDHTFAENDTSSIYNGKININVATAEELTFLPGIGQTMAKRIIDYRNEHGYFTELDELKNISGIGETRFKALAEYITLGPQFQP